MTRLAARRHAWLPAFLLIAACTNGGSPAPSSPGSSAPAASATPAGSAAAAFDPNAVSVTLERFVDVNGSPLAITNFGDGSNRLLVATKGGQLRVVKDGAVLTDPMLDISALVTNGGEQGLLGVAVHPDFPDDPRLFVDYTDTKGDTVVASYEVDGANPDRLDPATATTILGVDQPFANHNGGGLAFGRDGDLYVSLGDGGGGGDPQDNGEHLDTLLAKILRLDIDHAGPNGEPYSIPADNPFVNVAGARPEIWLTGLRNPWRFSFDRSTGDLWIGDVGQNAWEEIDVARAGVGGLDFGWDRMEGAHCFEPPDGCPTEGLTLPVTEYGHDEGCTIIGGVVSRGAAHPILNGGYLFADYCSGRIWAIDASVDGPLKPTRVGTAGKGSLVGFGEDEAGEVYAANLSGSVSRVVASSR